jgi:hypothetical protein
MRNPQFDVGLDHLGQGCVSVLCSQVRKSAATLSRSCAYLRTLLVIGAVALGQCGGRSRTRRKRFRGILGTARRFGDLGDQYGSVENSNLSAPGLDSVVAPHLCHRAVADHQMLANGRELQCVTPYLLGGGAERDRNQGCCDPGCVADRGSGPRRTILGCRRHNQRRRTRWVGTSPTRRPSNEERQVGRVGARVRGGRRPDHSTNYLFGRGGSCLAVCAMLR